ncbi:helix-turn-helix domain-containing protein [Streptantibioticus ferralitis]|uniref:Helix-turn-helix domain-containing protein n=1 Tax=Streptantibioticus ferralitis TaxID=236510 RepID=A0ABT5Z455_9ACTN|nr:helix-turn-helix domain-containing protein [Streptantibioticus ferralitis]MDF2258610.1 helix-turn-helix domain-containing protein [Streptantibioticus ferralitis]
MADRYLDVAQAAERLGTGVRFIRRLIAERRVAYAKFGSHVRIAETALDAYIEANTVQPAARRTRSAYGRAA